MTNATSAPAELRKPRARSESNLKFAQDGSYKSVEQLLHKLAIKCHARVKSMGLNLEYDDVFQEMNMSYVKAFKAWKPDGGSLFSTYCTTACMNNFNNAIKRMETERREMGMTSVHVLVSNDDGGTTDPLEVLGGEYADPSHQPDFRLQASQEMEARLALLTPNARRLVRALLRAEQERDSLVGISLRDLCKSLQITEAELRRTKAEIFTVYGVKWI